MLASAAASFSWLWRAAASILFAVGDIADDCDNVIANEAHPSGAKLDRETRAVLAAGVLLRPS